MSAAYLTEEQLRAITPEAAEGYLRARGWQRESVRRGTMSVWEKPGAPHAYVPLDMTYADYYRRVSDLLEALAADERRCPCRIYEDIRGDPLAGATVKSPPVPVLLERLRKLVRESGNAPAGSGARAALGIVERWANGDAW